MAERRLGVGGGVALYVGAVLGPGVLALPALAARVAGPASILSWLALLALSVPVAAAFAALGARYPDGGGVASFVARALGGRAATAVGWWFYFVIPIGVVAGALIGGGYVAAVLGGGRPTTVAVAVALLVVAFGANTLRLRQSGAVQLGLTGLLCLLLVVAVVAAAPHARTANLTPFAPHGSGAVLAATGVLFFGFVGWEAGTHLSAEFRDPRRHLPRVTALALAVVTVLYLALAGATVAVLGPAAARSPVPLTLLLERAFGPAARPVTAVVALLLSFGAINTYLASAARLGAALARQGSLPRRLAAVAPSGVPRPSLALLAVLTAGVMTLVAVLDIALDTLLRATTACLAAVTVAGMLAAVLLLRRRSAVWFGAILGGAATLAVLAATGPLLALPAALALAAYCLPHRRTGRPAADRPPARAGHG